jgi:hypothetical protein
MAEVFTGDLSQIRLVDILSLLMAERKTGKVTLTKGHTLAEIFVEGGEISHATAGSRSGEEAVYHMMAWTVGRFAYVPDEKPDSKTIDTPTKQILATSTQRVREWERIRRAIPSMDMVFRIAPRGDDDDMALKGSQWNVLRLLDGARTIREITRELGRGEMETLKTLHGLLQRGLIEADQTPKRPPKRTVGKSFFHAVEQELTLVMGPMAPVIIEDHIAAMDETMSEFPQDRAAELVESASLEISDKAKRVDFQRKMLETLKGL